MISTIALKEITEMRRDDRFRWAGAVVLALLLVSLGMGWSSYRELERQHATAQQETRKNWLTQGQKSPHSAAHYGVYAFKPKMPLSLVDRGVDPYTGVAVWLEAHKQNDFKYRPAQDANSLARFGELTASTVLQTLVPLLIILFSFAAFTGERENGTLRQLLSLGVAPSALAAGKALGVAGALGLLLVPAAAIGSAAIVMASGDLNSGRSILLGLFYLLYFGAFLGVALAISAWAKSSRVALIALLGFWIFNCLIVPRAAADLSKRAYPTPSSFSFAKAMQVDLNNGLDPHAASQERARELQARVLKQYKVERIEDLPVSYAGLSLMAGEEHGDEVYDRHYARLWDQFERQVHLQDLTGFVSPLMSVRSLSMGLAGTDFQQHRHFATAAEQYRRYFIQEVNADMVKNAVGKDYGYLRDNDLWSTVKEFRYTAPDLVWVLQQHRAALLLLSLWCLGGVALAYMATRRLRVE